MIQPDSRRIARGIFLAIAVWGTLLALGAMLYGVNPATGEVGRETDWQRGLIRGGVLFSCVFGFLAFWWFLLKRRERGL